MIQFLLGEENKKVNSPSVSIALSQLCDYGAVMISVVMILSQQ